MTGPDRHGLGRVVVVGATGNIGTAVLRRLRSSGATLVGVARRLPDTSAEPYDAATWVSCDVGALDAPQTLAEVMAGADAVVHLSWLIQPSHDENRLIRTNITGTRHVLEAAARTGVAHVLSVSSVGAYAAGPREHPVDESWPATGITTSSYGRHKAVQERLLDTFEIHHPDVVVSRVRPGLVFQPDAASEIARYFLGPLVPRRLARVRVPVVPVPGDITMQAVHADDLADAIARVLERRLPGPLNVAADPVLTPDVLADALGGRRVPVHGRAVRAGMTLTWRTRLQPTDGGWLDLARGLPVMSTRRAREELGWRPHHSSVDALQVLRSGMSGGAGAASPPMRPEARPPRRVVRVVARGGAGNER